MKLGPRFPNRPDHPDFWAMSRTVLAHDDDQTDIGEIIARYVDPESAVYMAEQRATRCAAEDRLPLWLLPTLAAVWIDGFITGVAVERDREA